MTYNNEIKDINIIINKYPLQCINILNNSYSYIHLKNFILSNSIALSSENYSFGQKVHWIVNGLSSFPRCNTCGKELSSTNNFKNFRNGYFKYCCKSCSNKNNDVKNKSKQTRLLLNNGQYFSKKSLQKAKQTFKRHYGVDNNMKSIIGIEEYKNKLHKKYGKNIDNIFQVNKIKDKIAYVKTKRYNDPKYNNPQKQIISFANRSLYQKQLTLRKTQNTNIQKYGVRHPMQNSDIRKRAIHSYMYKNIKFDSKPEIAFYIWLYDNKIEFKYQPNLSLKYYVNGIQHIYCPDFLIIDENKIIEIKGDQFFNKDGILINPYNENDNEKCLQKQKCMKQNDVYVMRKHEYTQYIEYVNLKYGKKYLDQFKIK